MFPDSRRGPEFEGRALLFLALQPLVGQWLRYRTEPGMLRGRGDRTFEYREIINAYSVENVEVADLNQDNKPDIIGVGVGLWTSINGGTSRLVEPRKSFFYGVPTRTGLFINEIMALNTSYQITNSYAPDWIEICNHNTFAQSLAGWSLAQYTKDAETNRWSFPTTNAISIPPFGHLVVYCGHPAPRFSLGRRSTGRSFAKQSVCTSYARV